MVDMKPTTGAGSGRGGARIAGEGKRLGRPRVAEKKTAVLTIRLPREYVERIRTLAKKARVSQGDYLVSIMRNHFAAPTEASRAAGAARQRAYLARLREAKAGK